MKLIDRAKNSVFFSPYTNSTFSKFSRMLVVFLLVPLALSTCKGKSGGDILQTLLCGRGEQKSKMTAGLNLDTIAGFFKLNASSADSSVSDSQVKEYINGFLEKTVSPETLSVASVESVGENDDVRFFQLGGTFGEGFGVAVDLLKSAFEKGDATSLSSNNPFTFINESFGVRAAAAEDSWRRRQVREFFESYLPFMATENAEPHADQWAYKQFNYTETQALFQQMLTKSGRDITKDPVVVAVLDTGVDLKHPDLADTFLKDKNDEILSYDATNSGTGAQDENGHGTHCAGIIGARKIGANSALGIATMANVKILPVKVLGAKGSGGFQEIEKGIRWAMHQGADVVSMSLGAGMEYSDLSKDEVPLDNKVFDEAIANKLLILVAAGNENCPLAGKCRNTSGLFSKKFENYTVLPCAYDHTICVGASDPDDTLAEYSNYWSNREAKYRTQADINAPGTAIYSTWPTSINEGYKTISGTSMATPFAAGVAALIKTVVPNITQAEVADILKRSQAYPDDIKARSNTGRINVQTALQITAREKLGMSEVAAPDVPPPAPVEQPPQKDTDGGTIELISSLWGAVCQ